MIFSDEKSITQLAKPEDPRIPTKKPHFRSADYNRFSRAQLLRVKLWKLHSCTLANYQQELGKFPGGGFYNQVQRNSTAFQNTIKHPTLRKCLKHVKKITFRPDLFSKHHYFLRICRTMRLESLSTSIISTMKPLHMLKAFMNSKLKYCSLYDPSKASTKDLLPKLIPLFRRFNKCRLFVQREENNIKMLLNPDKLRLKSSKPFLEHKSTPQVQHIRDQAIISPLNSLEKLSYQCYDHEYRGIEYIPALPPLPNIKALDFIWQGLVDDIDKKTPIDLSFVQQYPNLKSFKIQIMHGEIESLDFLADLPNLKEFYFFPSFSELKSGLPNLSSLERFGFTRWDEPSKFNFDGIRSLLQKNTGLKALKLSLPIQNIVTIFNEGQDLTLHHLKLLRLHFLQSQQPPGIESANKIARMLKTHHFIKELEIEFQSNASDWSSILLKEGLAEMKSLESLALKFHLSLSAGEIPQGIQFSLFPNIFQNLKNLKAIDLDLGAKFIESADLCFLFDGLAEFKNLEKFGLTAVFAKLTPQAFEKLLNFLISVRHVKSLHLYLRGVNQEEAKILRNNLLPKFPLSHDTFLFI